MAALHVTFDRQKDITRDMVRAAQLLREGLDTMDRVRGAMIQSIDGTTDDATHFDLLASLGGYQAGDYSDANNACKRSFDELDSLWGASQGSLRAALAQFCAIHAI